MGEGLARVITIGSIVLTVASLGLAVVFARKKTRVRVGFDVARAVIGLTAIVVMAAITNVVTPVMAVLVAVAVGVGLGFTQGSTLEISAGDRGLYATRTPIALIGWGAGIILMQTAGIASRTGAVQLGQTVAWFSACMGIGLIVGRTGPLTKSLARTGVATVIIALALPATSLIVGIATPAGAQTIQLTNEQICALTAPNRYAPAPDWGGIISGGDQRYGNSLSFSDAPLEAAIAACVSQGWYDYTGMSVPFAVYLFASDDDARSQFQREMAMGDEWFADKAGDSLTDQDWDTTQSYNKGDLAEFGLDGAWWSSMGSDDRVAAIIGPFMLFGNAYNIGFDLGEKGADGWRRPVTLIETMITPMVETVRNIEAFLAESSPPSDVPSPDSPPATTVAPVPPVDTSATSDAGDTALPPPPPGSAGPVTPEEAAGQAIAGVIAAAAIGLITWGEATGEITRILSGLGDNSDLPPKPPGPFLDPTDADTPLDVDPETGLVFWPWDGPEGRWVDPEDLPGLIDERTRVLAAENARRLARHDAQRERDWQDLRDRSGRSAQEAAARRAAERARFDAFDRRVEAARTWMEEADADSLDQLDRIMQRVADQGYVTDADIERAGRIADRARVWVSTGRQWDAEDWIRIESNRNTVLEVTAKGVSMGIDPTKGWVSGAIWGGIESYDRGDDMATVVGNTALSATLFRGSHAIGTWAPGRAALGRIGWGATGGSLSAGGETLIRGGSLEDAWHASQIGFVVGGIGGIAEEAATSGTRPPAELSTIRTTRGGPRVAYDTPSRPSLRPPERGGIGSMPESVPVIRVEPDGPRPHYDAPLSPRHIDPQDPRYVPPGTPASEIHTPPSDWSRPPPQIIEPQGPYGGQPRVQPPRVSPVDAFDQPPPVDVPDQPRPVGVPDQPPPIDLPERPPPPRLLPEEGPHAGRPPTQPPQVSPVDALDRPPLGDLPERVPPPTPEQLLEGARPTRPTPDVLDDMMNQPRHPAGTDGPGGVQEWQRGHFPDAQGRTMIDADGRVLVNDRHIGNIDPESGTLVNLEGDPMTVALDHRGVPAGYIERPDVPRGMNPAYNGRGELVGYVDDLGRADIGGERVPVAIDHHGNLVPYDTPRSTSPPAQHLPPEGLRGQSRPSGVDVEPTTGALAEPPVAGSGDVPLPTGQLEAPPPGDAGTPVDYTPYGQPVSAGDGLPPAAMSDLDTGPRIPVLDDNGGVAHLVEPGPREIHYDAQGTPHFVQRQHPVQPTPMRDLVIDPPNAPRSLQQMPTPEVYDATEAWHPLSGEGAPPRAPDVIRPTPPGGDSP